MRLLWIPAFAGMTGARHISSFPSRIKCGISCIGNPIPFGPIRTGQKILALSRQSSLIICEGIGMLIIKLRLFDLEMSTAGGEENGKNTDTLW